MGRVKTEEPRKQKSTLPSVAMTTKSEHIIARKLLADMPLIAPDAFIRLGRPFQNTQSPILLWLLTPMTPFKEEKTPKMPHRASLYLGGNCCCTSQLQKRNKSKSQHLSQVVNSHIQFQKHKKYLASVEMWENDNKMRRRRSKKTL